MECFQDCRIRLLSIWVFVIGSFNIAGLQPQSIVRAETLEVKIPAVAGGEALLPCDTRLDPPDVLLLVVWYKDDVPIYSFDSRVKSPSAHWADESLGGRAKWQQEPMSGLRIRNVLPTDRALYRCRVDFKSVPTRNHKIVLDVIELPEKPRIYDEQDKEVIGVAGPYVEDSSLKLTCVVSGGKPMPRVRWLRDDKVVAQLAPLEDGSSISTLDLRIAKLTRQYLDAVYTCTADNTQQVQALRVNVQIQLYLRPLSVEIIEREQPLSVGQETEIACRAVGARPPAVISWWLDGKRLFHMKQQKDSEDRNETTSVVRWTPEMEHDGRELMCRATHVKLDAKIETSMTLKLHYVPIVTLKLGSSMNPNDIEEGDDVYFDCTVKAFPPAYKVVWEHNGQILTHNQKGVVIAGSSNLVLQKASRELAGKYVCTASNVEGDGRSNPIHLQIIYKPVCTNAHTAIVGAALNEAAKVTCEVDAFPPPKNFQWTLNNSMGTVELESVNFTTDPKTRSVLMYTPTSETDYGTLACRAINLAGQQIEPCRYTLLPAVKPDPLVNCSSLNLTDDSVELRCTAGYDGGLLTLYSVEVWESGNVLANVTKPSPIWKLRGLGSGKQLRLVFYAHNARGRSESSTLRIHTLSRLALHTEAKSTNNVQVDASWALGIIAGIVGTLAVVIAIAVIARRRHHRPMQYEAPLQTVKAYKNSMHSANHSPIQPDDKNPDVVPLGKDFNCTRAVERPPEPPPYAVSTPPVGASRSSHSLQQDGRAGTPHTPNTPASDAQSIGTLAEDRRSVTSGTLTRRREVVTTRTPLLANARESCV